MKGKELAYPQKMSETAADTEQVHLPRLDGGKDIAGIFMLKPCFGVSVLSPDYVLLYEKLYTY